MRRATICLLMGITSLCSSVTAADLYIGGRSIWRNGELIAPTSSGEWPSLGIALDPVLEKVYWTRHFEGGIARADFDGTNVETIIAFPTADDPHPIAIDPVNRRAFWSDRGSNIMSANLDGTDVKELATGEENISGIVVDRSRQRVFWVETGSDFPGPGRIRSSGFEGGHVDTIPIVGINPSSIALDPQADQLYYLSDLSEDPGFGSEVHRVKVDGTGDIIVFKTDHLLGRMSIDFEERFIYFLGGISPVSRSALDGSPTNPLESVIQISLRSSSVMALRVPGDFGGDNSLNAEDIDLLKSDYAPGYDLDRDGLVSDSDREIWVRDLKSTWFGDTDLGGEFNSSDLVSVFEAGQYEDGIPMNSGWATGDWNGDGEFDTSDLVTAFTDGGYEQGPRGAASAVPEPTSPVMLVTGVIGLATVLRTRRSRKPYLILELSRIPTVPETVP